MNFEGSAFRYPAHALRPAYAWELKGHIMEERLEDNG